MSTEHQPDNAPGILSAISTFIDRAVLALFLGALAGVAALVFNLHYDVVKNPYSRHSWYSPKAYKIVAADVDKAELRQDNADLRRQNENLRMIIQEQDSKIARLEDEKRTDAAAHRKEKELFVERGQLDVARGQDRENVIRELREENARLQRRVDELTQTLGELAS